MRSIATLCLCLFLLTLVVPVAAQTTTTTQPQPPVAGQAMLDRGIAAAGSGNVEQAVMDFSLFILLNPTSARGHYMRGLSYYSLEQDEAAIRNFTEALRYSESNPELHALILLSRSETYLMLDNAPSALDDLSDMVAVQPTSESYARRGILRLTNGEFAGALADLDEAITRATNAQPALYYYRALANDSLQNPEAAAIDYVAWMNSINPQPTDEPRLQSGQPVILQMMQNAVFRIPFNVKRGEEISLHASIVSGTVDPLIAIVAPDGTPLVGSDDASPGQDTSAAVTDFVAPQSGTYTLMLSHAPTGYNGQVQVLLEVQ